MSEWGVTLTPILDGLKPLSDRRKRGGGIVLPTAVGFVVVFGFRILGDADLPGTQAIGSVTARLAPPEPGGWLVALLVFPILVLAAIAVHELGHASAARAAGFKLASLSVGPVAFIRGENGFRLIASFSDIVGGSAAFDTAVDQNLRRRLALMVAGGPFATLGGLVLSAFLVGSGALADRPLAEWVAGAFGLISLILTAEVLPFRAGGHESDGALLWMLLRNPARTRAWLSLLDLTRELERGVRPGDLNPDWLRWAREAPPDSRDSAYAEYLSYAAAFDRNDADAAATHLEASLQRASVAPREVAAVLPTEAAIFSAWFRRDPGRARMWYKRWCGTSDAGFQAARFDVALAVAEGRTDDALAAWSEGLRLLEALPTGPQRSGALAAWGEWRARLAPDQ